MHDLLHAIKPASAPVIVAAFDSADFAFAKQAV